MDLVQEDSVDAPKASRKAEDLQRTYCNVATRGKADSSHAWHLSKMQLVCWILLAVRASVRAW